MKRLIVVPTGIPVTLDELEPGMFMTVEPPFSIGVKDEYDGKGYNSAGEYWCSNCLLMPCTVEEEEL